MPKPPTLTEVLTLARVQSLADAKSFARGNAYFRDGAVSRLEEDKGAVCARVRGTHDYRVHLAVNNAGGLAYRCDCPVGNAGVFCKHAIAVALCWLKNSSGQVVHAEETPPEKPRKKRKSQADVMREYVATLDRDALEDLVLDAATFDRTLRDKLLLAARAAQGPDLQGMKAIVRQLTHVSRPLDWREAAEYGDGLMSLADMLRQRLAGPYAAQVVELSDLAIASAEHSLLQIDDSGGYVMPAIVELAEIHLEACLRTRPDPLELAERLFRRQTEQIWDIFDTVLPTYEEALGESGVRRYRELLDEAWNALPALAPGQKVANDIDSRRSRLERAMLALAESDGDVDALIRICSRDLSSPYRYLKVATICQEHDRLQEGLAWAKRGIEGSSGNVELSLLGFCVHAHLRGGEFEEANAYAWQCFEMQPSVRAFLELMKVATATGRHDEMRDRALKHLWALAEKQESAAPSTPAAWWESMRTVLVEIFLSEGNHDLAWDAFIGGPMPAQKWAEMAAVRSATHPRDALDLYRKLLPIAVNNGSGGGRYEEAFDVVCAIRRLRAQLGEGKEFASELEEIRQTYRVKRNFIKLLATLH